jgi:Carboxypeptidase regulatory-like domain
MLHEKLNLWDAHRRRLRVLLEPLPIWLLTLMAVALLPAVPVLAQNIEKPGAQGGTIVGTVTDVNDNTVPGATVALQGGPVPGDRRSVATTDNGAFEFDDVKSGISYRVIITAKGFAAWTSPIITLTPGQYKILAGSKLRIEQARSTVNVGYSSVEVATEQVRVAESQRIFGIIPNFYVVYDKNAVPLTPKLKFRLALRVSIDPVTFAGIAIVAAADQAGDTPDYQQGALGYAQRFGATTLDGFTDIMIGGAILPSLLHQDPRYFYQGTGTTKSRAFHALSYPFVCKGDNGKQQPNYSSLGGDLASSALSNAYYPPSNRGAGLVFENFAISTGERVAATLVQEFVLRKLTKSKDSKVAASQPSQPPRNQDR